MKLIFIIGIIIGLILIIHSVRKILNLTKMIKTKATITGFHSHMNRSDITRVEFMVNKVSRECDLHYRSIFYKRGKKINIYYNPDKYWEINCVEGYIFTLIMGFLFMTASIYGIII